MAHFDITLHSQILEYQRTNILTQLYRCPHRNMPATTIMNLLKASGNDTPFPNDCTFNILKPICWEMMLSIIRLRSCPQASSLVKLPESFLNVINSIVTIWRQNVFEWLSSIAANLQWVWGLNFHRASLPVFSYFFTLSSSLHHSPVPVSSVGLGDMTVKYQCCDKLSQDTFLRYYVSWYLHFRGSNVRTEFVWSPHSSWVSSG